MVPLDAKLGLYMKELASIISSVGEMVILASFTGMGKLEGLDMKSVSGTGISSVRGMAILESLDGLDMRELVSAVSSVREVVILISSMENRGLGACVIGKGKPTAVLVSAAPRSRYARCQVGPKPCPSPTPTSVRRPYSGPTETNVAPQLLLPRGHRRYLPARLKFIVCSRTLR